MAQESEILKQEAAKLCELADKGDVAGLKKLANTKNVNLLHKGMTPMMYAVLNPSKDGYKCVEALFFSKAKTDVFSDSGETVLHMAARINRHTVIDIFYAAKDFPLDVKSKTGDTPLIVAARDGSQEFVKKLLKLKPDALVTGEDGRTAADRANEWKSHSKMFYDIFDYECEQRRPMRHLLELKVESVCKYAQSGKHQILRRELTDDIINCRQFTKTPMMFAAEAPGDSGVQCLDLLIDRHALRHLSDKYGWTAAHYAAKNNKQNFLAHLGNANIDIPDKYGVTPLMVAAQNGYQSCVTTLVQMGANVNARNKQNKTARDIAETNRHKNLNFDKGEIER